MHHLSRPNSPVKQAIEIPIQRFFQLKCAQNHSWIMLCHKYDKYDPVWQIVVMSEYRATWLEKYKIKQAFPPATFFPWIKKLISTSSLENVQ